MFADNILLGKSPEEVNKWTEVLESNILRISRGKTEYIEYDFGKRKQKE